VLQGEGRSYWGSFGAVLTAAALAAPAHAQIAAPPSVPTATVSDAADAAQPGEADYYGPRLVRSEVRIPVAGGAYTIAATILRPEGPGPYGAVVLNHGVPGSAAERRVTSADDFARVAPVFARRGYAVIIPIRRGFGTTGGEFAEDAGSCRSPDYVRGENAAADDVMAAYDYARSLPYVDGNRMVLAGQSAGGVVSIFAAATRHPQGLLAVLGFAAGRGGNPDINPGVPCAAEPMAQMFEDLGRSVAVPVLWHYAENDQYFNAATSAMWFKRFSAGGAHAQYVLQPPFGRDGHHIFGELIGVEFWLPVVERFFGEYRVPFQRLDATDPAAQPLLSAKLPYVKSASCTGLYRVFLESAGPRAYALSGDGHCGFAAGVKDAQAQALRECASRTALPCALYAVDAAIVWKTQEPATATLRAGLDAAASQGK
jgi:dienelactone hydrolase